MLHLRRATESDRRLPAHPSVGRAGTFSRLFVRDLRGSFLKICRSKVKRRQRTARENGVRADALLRGRLKHAAVLMSRHEKHRMPELRPKPDSDGRAGSGAKRSLALDHL